MKQLQFSSFRQRLNAAFLAVSLVPVLLCSALLLQIFRFRMTADRQQNAEQQLDGACHALSVVQEGLQEAAQTLGRSETVIGALSGGWENSASVYSALYTATEEVRRFAQFALYDAEGTLRYSTQTAPGARTLSVSWGVFKEAADEDGIVYCASIDPTDLDEPILRAAARLTQGGQTVGFFVASFYEAQFRAMLDALAGAQNALLVMDGFWHGIYCSQQAQVQTLSNALRGQLLRGKALTGLSDNFVYTARQEQTTGLFFVLQQPQVFTRGTLRLLYTVSALCALGGVAVSIVLSLQLSRQVFQPIGTLHRAITQVGRNDLEVQVPVREGQCDELGELAQQFNGMVLSLRRNQQALLENQQALNDAQIRMMQAQLNPHFLCNTLDTMKWISKINQVPQVALMSTNLADILRFCISPDEFVELRRELEILGRYVEIQRIRLSDSFTFEQDVPERLLSCMVPKMMLQPLAENAILHGLSGVQDGRLTVTAREEDGVLEICVLDNGCGFPAELLGQYKPPEKQTGHLGLFNVDTILRKHYGESFGLRLENRKDGAGACIAARLPARRRDTDAAGTGGRG
mgnify:CR=1 FL=1